MQAGRRTPAAEHGSRSTCRSASRNATMYTLNETYRLHKPNVWRRMGTSDTRERLDATFGTPQSSQTRCGHDCMGSFAGLGPQAFRARCASLVQRLIRSEERRVGKE